MGTASTALSIAFYQRNTLKLNGFADGWQTRRYPVSRNADVVELVDTLL